MLLSLAAVVFLTWQSVSTHDWAQAERQGKIVAKVEIDKTSAGYALFKGKGCIACHGDSLQGGAGAPTLIGTGLKPDQIAKIAKNGRGKMPAGIFKGTDAELKTLTEFISGLGAK
jgi:menaquinol-cytochrome c reductase cytochrome b/c subunit